LTPESCRWTNNYLQRESYHHAYDAGFTRAEPVGTWQRASLAWANLTDKLSLFEKSTDSLLTLFGIQENNQYKFLIIDFL
jgi:hypothetical protein